MFDIIDSKLLKCHKKVAIWFWDYFKIDNFYLSALCIGVGVFLVIKNATIPNKITIVAIQSAELTGLLYLLNGQLTRFQKDSIEIIFWDVLVWYARIGMIAVSLNNLIYINNSNWKELGVNILIVISIYFMSIPTLPPSKNKLLNWLRQSIPRERVRVPIKK